MSLSNHKSQVMHYLFVDTFRWSIWYYTLPLPMLSLPNLTTPYPHPPYYPHPTTHYHHPTLPPYHFPTQLTLPPPTPTTNNGLERSQFIDHVKNGLESDWSCQWLVICKIGAGAGDGSKHYHLPPLPPHPHHFPPLQTHPILPLKPNIFLHIYQHQLWFLSDLHNRVSFYEMIKTRGNNPILTLKPNIFLHILSASTLISFKHS